MAFNFNTMIGGGGTANLKNYIAGGTTITVKSDGTGDFTSLKDAVNSLTGKFSDGKVTISIGAGTFDITETVVIDGGNFNFAELEISGAGKENTIIQNTSATQYVSIISITNSGALIICKDFCLKAKDSSSGIGVSISKSDYVYLENLKTENCLWGIYPDFVSKVWIQTLTGSNLADAMNVNRGSEAFCRGTFTLSDVTTAFQVSNASLIKAAGVTKTFTNVTNSTNQTTNQITNNGIIIGNV